MCYSRVGDGALTTGPVAASITFTNQNDAPVVDDQTIGPVDENSAAGTVVGTVVASDVDAGQSLTYAITAGNTSGAFAIDPGTGEITVANASARRWAPSRVMARAPVSYRDISAFVTYNGQRATCAGGRSCGFAALLPS